MLEDKYAELQAAKESPDVPEVDEEGKPLTKKARKELLKAAEKEREKRTAAESQRVDPEVKRVDPEARQFALPCPPLALRPKHLSTACPSESHPEARTPPASCPALPASSGHSPCASSACPADCLHRRDTTLTGKVQRDCAGVALHAKGAKQGRGLTLLRSWGPPEELSPPLTQT